MNAPAQPRRPIESGVPDPFPFMHPVMKKNYGNWSWHDRLRPGVLHHVAKNGDEIWTVRAGTPRQMDVFSVRKLCGIADQFAEGHVLGPPNSEHSAASRPAKACGTGRICRKRSSRRIAPTSARTMSTVRRRARAAALPGTTSAAG